MIPATISTSDDQQFATGSATYPPRRCQWCGRPAEIHDVDGCWCSSECQLSDRSSEVTVWRRWQS